MSTHWNCRRIISEIRVVLGSLVTRRGLEPHVIPVFVTMDLGKASKIPTAKEKMEMKTTKRKKRIPETRMEKTLPLRSLIK